MESEKQDRSFNMVRVKYISLNDIKSVILSKLESWTSQRQIHIEYIELMVI